MGTRAVTVHVAYCDVCLEEADPGSGQGATPRAAIEDLTVHDGEWQEADDGRLVCPASNPAHDQARGSESPFLLAMSPDAMTATFPALGTKENQPA
jgi:hypothetical protein